MLYPLTVIQPQAALVPLTHWETRKLSLAFGVVLMIAAYVLSISLFSKIHVGSSESPLISLSLGYVCGVIPFLSAFTILLFPGGEVDEKVGGDSMSSKLIMIENINAGGEEEETREGEEGLLQPNPVHGASLLQALRTIDFWLLFCTLFTVCGAGLTVVNNVGDMTTSLGGDDSTKNVLVVIFSVCNCLGRLCFGTASDVYRATLSRPIFLVLSAATMALGCTIVAIAPLPGLYPGVALAGIAYGGIWGTFPSLLADRFSTLAIGAISGFSTLAVALGSYVFSAALASGLYQARASSDGKCVGQTCFSTTFAVLAGANAIIVLAGIALTRKLSYLFDKEGKARPYMMALEARDGIP